MSSPLIVLLAGWAGSGKDAAAALMVEEMGFKRDAFADVMKVTCAHACHLPLEDFTMPSRKDVPLRRHSKEFPEAKTPRDILLEYGRRKRAVDDAVFARQVAENIKEALSYTNRFVISDWRYPIELTHLQAAFPTATIVRARITRASVQQRADISEHLLDAQEFDVVISNDGCISDLRDEIRRQLRQWLHPHDHHLIGISFQDGS